MHVSQYVIPIGIKPISPRNGVASIVSGNERLAFKTKWEIIKTVNLPGPQTANRLMGIAKALPKVMAANNLIFLEEHPPVYPSPGNPLTMDLWMVDRHTQEPKLYLRSRVITPPKPVAGAGKGLFYFMKLVQPKYRIAVYSNLPVAKTHDLLNCFVPVR